MQGIGPDYGFYELPNNELYQGELKNLNYHGKGKYRHSSGMIEEGIFEIPFDFIEFIKQQI